MNDMNDAGQAQAGAGASADAGAGFCQNCGRPLTNETIRRVGSAVYCEPCLEARLGGPGAVPPTGAGAAGYGPVGYGAGGYATGESWASSFSAARPNPGLAALLGLIPGVGAMYNEQYAKGIVHLVVFAVLVSLADNVNGIFGLFVAGWVFYMAIEAHHTARARRDGTPLPNPFGLNDIGERLGFGRSWPTGPSVTEVAHDAAAAAAQGFQHTAGAAPPYPGAPYQAPAYQAPAYQTPGYQAPAQAASAPWGAPVEGAGQASYTQVPYGQVPYAQVPFGQPGHAEQFAQATQAQAYRDAGFVPPPSGYGVPYAAVPPIDPALFVPAPSRFPAGAVWLIGLGTLFLLTTTGLFNGFPGEALIGCILLGIGVWVFLRRMLESGVGFANDGTAGYPARVLRALRFAVWLAVLGLLFLLDAFHILTWRHSWPFLVILAGVMALVQRAAFQASAVSYAHPAAAPVAPAAANDSTDLTNLTKGGL